MLFVVNSSDTLVTRKALITKHTDFIKCNDSIAAYKILVLAEISSIDYSQKIELLFCRNTKFDTSYVDYYIVKNDTVDSNFYGLHGNSSGSVYAKHWDMINENSGKRVYVNSYIGGDDILTDTMQYNLSIDYSWGSPGEKAKHFKEEINTKLGDKIALGKDGLNILIEFKKVTE